MGLYGFRASVRTAPRSRHPPAHQQPTSLHPADAERRLPKPWPPDLLRSVWGFGSERTLIAFACLRQLQCHSSALLVCEAMQPPPPPPTQKTKASHRRRRRPESACSSVLQLPGSLAPAPQRTFYVFGLLSLSHGASQAQQTVIGTCPLPAPISASSLVHVAQAPVWFGPPSNGSTSPWNNDPGTSYVQAAYMSGSTAALASLLWTSVAAKAVRLRVHACIKFSHHQLHKP